MEKRWDVIVIGSGMAGLTSAALLARAGQDVLVLEQNWIPGGCTTSYPRKHFVFEAGATTLVGLDEHMPLKYLLDKTGISLKPRHLKLPMQVHLNDGTRINRFEDLQDWIGEAERVFGKKGQREFWEHCFRISEVVWQTSLMQKAFPPDAPGDLLNMVANVRPMHLRHVHNAFRSTLELLKKYGLDENRRFREFVDEQLLITAQNTAEEVNALFGATALCYTNYGNFYVDGGMRQLIEPIVEYVKSRGGELQLRTLVTGICRQADGYEVQTKKSGVFRAKKVVSAIPLNNTLPLFGNGLSEKFSARLMQSKALNSAFQMGIAFKKHREYEAIHHQIHLPEPLPLIGSKSIFLSLSHPEDRTRCGRDEVVASISTHFPDPENLRMEDKTVVEEAVFQALEALDLLRRENILYQHSSTPGAWNKWTARKWGFVGGYPQYMNIKPWQMMSARLDKKGAYICGDSTYPGQGIPGACLSGIIAAEKLLRDQK